MSVLRFRGNDRHSRRRAAAMAQQLGLHLLLICGAMAILLPFYWMLSTSLKPAGEVIAHPIKWVPSRLVWGNYAKAINELPVSVLVFMRNSLVLSVSVMLGSVLANAVVAYPFARLRFRGRSTMFLLILGTMMIPGQVTMIPLFVLFSRLHWVNSFRPLIVPAFFGNAYYIFLMRQFFATIPRELEDAAKIDGCSPYSTFLRIILPMSGPALGVVAIFTFSDTWNDFMGPLIYLNELPRFPLALALRSFQRRTGGPVYWESMMAVAILMTLPVLVLYYVAQRNYIQGIVVTGVKG
jgi:multiple sugar transport system permease protein